MDIEFNSIKELYDRSTGLEYSSNIKYFERFANYLNPGGVIITDNLKFHGLVKNKDLIKSRNVKGIVNKIEKYIDALLLEIEYYDNKNGGTD